MSSLPGYPRSPDVLRWVAKSLDVESPDCFTAGVVLMPDGTLMRVTRCNAYARCGCVGLGVQVPSRMSADQLAVYFTTQAAQLDGWSVVDFETAKQRAEGGFPTLAIYKSRPPDKHGHVALMMPKPNDRQLSTAELASGWCSAAGGENATHQICTLAATFGTALLPLLVFVTHD